MDLGGIGTGTGPIGFIRFYAYWDMGKNQHPLAIWLDIHS